MKFTTARRIIKEHKKGLVAHTPELLEQAHARCHEHHDLVARGKMAEAEIAAEVKVQQGRLAEAGKMVELTGGMSPEEFARRQVKLGRQGRLDPSRVAHARGKIQPNVRIDPEGNPVLDENGVTILNYDSMGNPSIAKPEVVPIKMAESVGEVSITKGAR